jgi:hypothetical protein
LTLHAKGLWNWGKTIENPAVIGSGLFNLGRLSENERFFARSRKAKILTARIH